MNPLRCTYCNGDAFTVRAQNGQEINLQCSNQDCRHLFQYDGSWDALFDLKQIGEGKKDAKE